MLRKNYCRLEIFCVYDIDNNELAIKEKSLSVQNDKNLKYVKDYDVYVEKYQDFISVKNRIIKLGNIWKQYHPEIEIPWTEEEKKACYSGKKETSRNIYISVVLYNQWGDNINVGISHAGWVIPEVSCYTLEYENNIIKLGNIDFSNQRIFVIFTPQVTEFFECDFISEKSACSLIKEWLETGEYTKHSIKRKLFPGNLNNNDYYSIIPF